jgi:predicted nucleic acid-binding protein
MQFVDTNIFLRHLTGDDPRKAQACFELFKKAQRKEVILTTSESVIAEVVYVLESAKQIYNLDRGEIRARLYPLVSLAGLKLAYRRVYLRALDLYAASSVDFEDALTVARMEQQKITGLYSYDRDFDRFPEIKRLEP